MPPFTIHSRHSWPPGNHSAPLNDTSIDENPFAFYLSPAEDGEIDAGIAITPPRSRSRSPFSIYRRRSSTFHHGDDLDNEDTISTVRMAGKSPTAVFRRWANFVEKTYPHLSLKSLYGGHSGNNNIKEATVAIVDADEWRGRGLLATASMKDARRRSRSWQPPAGDLWTVEEEGDEGWDSEVEEERARRVREGAMVSRGRGRGRGEGRGKGRGGELARL
ncbi:MAG: hypothetical protein M1813_005084 [Trichoglossum hirsutum]|nr:MAG: hypothetical protein M1813_005084 [Trichoglossum hirsutum]